MSSNRRQEANKKNATKSTGPRTDTGKAHSRENAIKHGLTSIMVVTNEVEEAITERLEAWYPGLKTSWDARQVVLASIRIDRCQTEESVRRGELMEMARDENSSWDIDRELEAAELGRKLSCNPMVHALKLRTTHEGRMWIRNQWQELMEILETQEGGLWNDAQVTLVQDLLGIRAELRESPRISDVRKSTEKSKSLAVSEIQKLDYLDMMRHNESKKRREKAKGGYGLDKDVVIRSLTRYESTAKRDMKLAEAALLDQVNFSEGEEIECSPKPVVLQPAVIVKPAQPQCEPKPTPSFEVRPAPAPRVEIQPKTPTQVDIRITPEPVKSETRTLRADKPEEPPIGNRRYRRAMAKKQREQAGKAEMAKRLANLRR